MQAKRPPAVFFSMMIAAYLVIAFVLAILFASFKVDSAALGAAVGFLLWLGVAAPIAMTEHISTGKPWGVYFINVSYQLIYLVLIGAILGGWR